MKVKSITHLFDQMNNAPEPKLWLMNAPTGSGKSHVTIHALCQFTAAHQDFKAFFVTDQKKNLKLETFAAAWNENSDASQSFAQAVGFIRSLADTDMLIVSDRNAGKIPQSLLTPKVDQAIDRVVQQLNLYQLEAKSAEVTSGAWTHLNETDFQLRQALAETFAQTVGLDSPTNKLGQDQFINYLAMHQSAESEWLNAAYPTIGMATHRIFVMTTDKFIRSYTPFFSHKSIPFQYSMLLKGALVVLDEFDTAKERMWDQAIDNALKVQADLTVLFKSIYEAFQRFDQLPRQLSDLLTVGDGLAGLTKRAQVLREKYALDQLYRSAEGKIDTGFVLHLPQRNLISQGRAWHAYSDPTKHQVIIGEEVRDSLHFQGMLFAVSAFIKRFAMFILKQARRFQDARNVARPSLSDGMTIREACYTIYDALGLTADQAEVLMSLGLNQIPKRREQAKTVKAHYRRFQEQGLKLFNFVNDSEHDLRTDINASYFSVTPERFLLGILDKANVLGLSATATIRTVLDNFDLNYLKQILGDRFEDVTEAVMAADGGTDLATAYVQAGVTIHPAVVTIASSIEDILQTRLGAKFAELNLTTVNEMDQALEEQANLAVAESEHNHDADYLLRRYLHLFDSFVVFLLDDTMTSFLGLQTLLPGNQAEMSQQYLEQVFKQLRGLLITDSTTTPQLQIISSTNAETIDTQIESALAFPSEQETRVYLLSSYRTLGTGQNLQHKMGDFEINLVKRVGQSQSNKADPRFDSVDLAGIYLGDVTHILSSDRHFQMDAAGIRLVTELEYLADNNEISYQTLKAQLSALQKGLPRKQPQSVLSLVASYSRTIIQAVGRMNRSFNKVPNIKILVAPEVIEKISQVGIDMHAVSPEYQALITYAEKQQHDFQATQAEAEKENLTRYTARDLKALVPYLQVNAEAAEYYRASRDFVLKHPTVSMSTLAKYLLQAEHYQHWMMQYLTFEQPQNHYSVKPLYVDSGEFNFEGSGVIISAEAAGMAAFCAYPGLQRHLIDQGITVEWQPEELMINPTQFINLYLGALGEVTGKFIFEAEWPGAKLHAFDQVANNELFDYYLESNIAIDFKNWRGMPDVDPQKERQHVIEKLRKLEQNTGRQWMY